MGNNFVIMNFLEMSVYNFSHLSVPLSLILIGPSTLDVVFMGAKRYAEFFNSVSLKY